MRNIKLTIEYHGARYAGWQVQPNRVSVQELIEKAIAGITGERDVTLVGSGRTDAGVHAARQVANFKTNTTIPPENLAAAINTKLPDDIAIIAAEDAPDDFHARYSAKAKTYRYSILNRPVRSPLGRDRKHFVPQPLDVPAMRRAAKHLVAERDFAAFQSKPNGRPTVRTVTRLDIAAAGPCIDIYITANGFLYNMVRAIVGTLIDVGLGKRPPENLEELLKSADRSAAGPTAPPQGLCLLEVEY